MEIARELLPPRLEHGEVTATRIEPALPAEARREARAGGRAGDRIAVRRHDQPRAADACGEANMGRGEGPEARPRVGREQPLEPAGGPEKRGRRRAARRPHAGAPQPRPPELRPRDPTDMDTHAGMKKALQPRSKGLFLQSQRLSFSPELTRSLRANYFGPVSRPERLLLLLGSALLGRRLLLGLALRRFLLGCWHRHLPQQASLGSVRFSDFAQASTPSTTTAPPPPNAPDHRGMPLCLSREKWHFEKISGAESGRWIRGLGFLKWRSSSSREALAGRFKASRSDVRLIFAPVPPPPRATLPLPAHPRASPYLASGTPPG